MIKVLKAGFYASIQDKGRQGFASIGVPVSGVMDEYSANLANSILNNSLEFAVLEITFGGTQLQFLTDTFICISGGDFSPKINQKSILINARISVSKNDVLSFGKINFGVRCYLAVKEGFQSKKILQSRSFYQNITDDFIIKKNEILPVKKIKAQLKSTNTSVGILKSYFKTEEIKCFKGPEYDLLNDDQKKQLTNLLFTISNDNNRMGYRLNETIKNNLPSILTSAVLPGTVQLTPSGKIIVLMKDCQVTGGYPRVLQLTENSIGILSQKTTHNSLKFTLISI
ncbi:biotin-dependent carboxyltransferase family protein [Polaribacter sargassicola]|uniref:5-oxoprolinase subunit C family protein n=1 Tax=Polaribacter sargassicola TaxID=2836891 RepID=UPI001F319A06|nr:biotin-dependent carboxyltransferase family protein [Polaribacter sp. DS7-9]MCG1036055.1 biotin-dependent carboxyltransferase family protein [Polaribacter sp. DS7-9]